MIRKIILVLILIILDNYPWLQGMLIIVNSTIALFFLIVHKPIDSTFGQRVEVWNECLILLAAHTNLNFLLQAPPETEEQLENLKDNCGWGLIFLILMNMFTNIIIVGIQSFIDIFRSMRVLFYKFRAYMGKYQSK